MRANRVKFDKDSASLYFSTERLYFFNNAAG